MGIPLLWRVPFQGMPGDGSCFYSPTHLLTFLLVQIHSFTNLPARLISLNARYCVLYPLHQCLKFKKVLGEIGGGSEETEFIRIRRGWQGILDAPWAFLKNALMTSLPQRIPQGSRRPPLSWKPGLRWWVSCLYLIPSSQGKLI